MRQRSDEPVLHIEIRSWFSTKRSNASRHGRDRGLLPFPANDSTRPALMSFGILGRGDERDDPAVTNPWCLGLWLSRLRLGGARK
jgi:hypothetical protein